MCKGSTQAEYAEIAGKTGKSIFRKWAGKPGKSYYVLSQKAGKAGKACNWKLNNCTCLTTTVSNWQFRELTSRA